MLSLSPSRSRGSRAFSLLELVVVLVVIAVLSVLAVPSMQRVISSSRVSSAEQTLGAVLRDAQALVRFEDGTGWQAAVGVAVGEVAGWSLVADGNGDGVSDADATSAQHVAFAVGGDAVGVAAWVTPGIAVYGLVDGVDGTVVTWSDRAAGVGDPSVALAGPAAEGGSPAPTVPAPTVVAFAYTGAPESFVVPAGVTEVVVEAFGAQGGVSSDSFGGTGGLGASVTATLAVTPGETLQVRVGGRGLPGSVSRNTDPAGTGGGWNGGGNAFNDWYTGGGGGGASDVRRGGTALADRVLVAGGGGGAGGGPSSHSGGAGGAPNGGNGAGLRGGGGASTSAGGAAGSGTNRNQTAGVLGVGGRGTNIFTAPLSGGGGGGLYGGGGGGQGEAEHAGGMGGGGGSSLIPAGGSGQAGVRAGHGAVTITYTG